MFLTRDEFNRIRPLQWTIQNYGNTVYNTINGRTETQLFWLDFMRLVFAPKYTLQNGIITIDNFDQTQPVLLTDDLELILPNDIDLAMYYANNTTLPMKFIINIPKLIVLVMVLLTFIILIVLNVKFDGGDKSLQANKILLV